MSDEQHDPAAVRALAAAVLAQAVREATAEPSDDPARERSREDAIGFLVGPRAERWCDACGIDAEALRDRLAFRLEAVAA